VAVEAAEPLSCNQSAQLITIRELSVAGQLAPHSSRPQALPCWWRWSARLVARRTRSSWWRWPPWCWLSARSGHAPSPSLRRPAPGRPGLPPAAAAGVGRRHPQRGGSSSPRVGDPTRSRDPKTDHAALALGWPETVCVVAMASPGSAQERRRLMLERFRVGGWLPRAHIDGWDSSGQRTCWEEWEHWDGRRAIESTNGRCTDPELEGLLRARREAGKERRRWRVLAAAARVWRWWLRVLSR
jgi:hypothetical protein